MVFFKEKEHCSLSQGSSTVFNIWWWLNKYWKMYSLFSCLNKGIAQNILVTLRSLILNVSIRKCCLSLHTHWTDSVRWQFACWSLRNALECNAWKEWGKQNWAERGFWNAVTVATADPTESLWAGMATEICLQLREGDEYWNSCI